MAIWYVYFFWIQSLYIPKKTKTTYWPRPMIRFRDLTEEEKSIICNGCGAKGGWFPVPEFLFHASCDHHDFNYWLGHTEEDRERADHEFLEAMLIDAGDDKKYQTLAITYWLAVRVFGKQFFHYSSRERNEDDLHMEVMEAKV